MSDTNTESEVLKGIARALWLSAYADGIENKDITGDQPGAQEDWDDFAPDTPSEAHAGAYNIASRLALLGRGPLATLYNEWRALTGRSADRFGHCVGMQYLGHGVGLEDDLPPGAGYDRLDVGYGDFSIHNVNIHKVDGVEFIQSIEQDGCTVRLLRVDDVLTVGIEDDTAERLVVRVGDSIVFEC